MTTQRADAPAGPMAEPVEPAGVGPPRWERVLRWLAVPLLIFAATRVAQLVLLSWLLPPGGSVRDRLLSWDGGWFVRVARDGYPAGFDYDENGAVAGNGLAFFPVYPLLMRGTHALLGVDHGTAALIIGWLAAAAAAVLLYALGTALYDARAGAAFTALVCAQPMSVVLSMAYSEGLFLALVAGALLAAYRDRWLVAGALGLLAGLTRATGAALALALAVGALLYVLDPAHRGRRWRAIVGAGLALCGVPLYLAWVALRVGEPDAWFRIQTAGWGTSFDFGVATWQFVRDALRGGEVWVHVSVAWLLLAAVVTAVVAVRMRIWPPLLVYGLISLILVVGQAGYYHSKPRLLVTVLVTLVPPAVALGRARLTTAVPVLIGYAFFGLWYGAYLLTVWRYAI